MAHVCVCSLVFDWQKYFLAVRLEVGWTCLVVAGVCTATVFPTGPAQANPHEKALGKGAIGSGVVKLLGELSVATVMIKKYFQEWRCGFFKLSPALFTWECNGAQVKNHAFTSVLLSLVYCFVIYSFGIQTSKLIYFFSWLRYDVFAWRCPTASLHQKSRPLSENVFYQLNLSLGS